MTLNRFATWYLATSMLLVAAVAQASDTASPEWVKTLKNMGKVYSNDDGGVVQGVKVFSRIHGQWNYSDGESAGTDFNGSGEEIRRLRAGVSVSFLDGFTALGRANLEEGGFGYTDLGYDSWDELYLSYSKKGWLGLDSASLGYGRYRVLFGGIRPTGLVFNAEKDGVDYILGVWSREPEPEDWAGWDDAICSRLRHS